MESTTLDDNFLLKDNLVETRENYEENMNLVYEEQPLERFLPVTGFNGKKIFLTFKQYHSRDDFRRVTTVCFISTFCAKILHRRRHVVSN